MNNILDKLGKINDCTGCGMCAAVCPKNAINIELNKDGFYRPIVNNDLCVSCGICKKVCYCFEDDYNKGASLENVVCFSAKNKDKIELNKASSGGVSIELMRQCLEEGYKVVGVAYDYEREIAVTKIASSEDELGSFRGSKYFQSYTLEALKEIVENTNSKYAIFGTPCQIYAVSKFSEVKKFRNRFLLIDIFCHGCPSINLWKKYLDSYEKKCSADRFDEIRFRSKTYGWHEYCIDFVKGVNVYSSNKYNDPFFEMFYGKDIMNEACYECKARSYVCKTDIRLGDFWGWQFDLDNQGVSAVVCNTDKGKELFEKVKHKFITENFDFEEVIKDQSYGKNHLYDKHRREFLLSRLSSDNDIYRIQKQYRKKFPVIHSIKRVLKNMLKFCGRRFYLVLRQKKHKANNEWRA